MESDLDLIVLTTDKTRYVASETWVLAATGQTVSVVRTGDWGPLVTERRVRLESGFEIEFGFAPPEWAATAPADAGTAQVVARGFRILFDPTAQLARLVEGAPAADSGTACP